jgi:hypothetical protein
VASWAQVRRPLRPASGQRDHMVNRVGLGPAEPAQPAIEVDPGVKLLRGVMSCGPTFTSAPSSLPSTIL